MIAGNKSSSKQRGYLSVPTLLCVLVGKSTVALLFISVSTSPQQHSRRRSIPCRKHCSRGPQAACVGALTFEVVVSFPAMSSSEGWGDSAVPSSEGDCADRPRPPLAPWRPPIGPADGIVDRPATGSIRSKLRIPLTKRVDCHTCVSSDVHRLLLRGSNLLTVWSLPPCAEARSPCCSLPGDRRDYGGQLNLSLAVR